MTESASPGAALEGTPPGNDPGRVSLVVSVSVLAVIVLVAVGLYVGSFAPGSESTSGPGCLPVGGVCMETFRLTGKPGKLPTTDEFAASMATNERIVFEWHRSGTGAMSMPVMQGYEGFLLRSGCTGSGSFTVAIDLGVDGSTSLTVGCDGSIGPGLGFPPIEVPTRGPRPLGPYVFSPSTVGQVSDAEFFVTGAMR
jgi:hypothetical protein